MPVIGRRASTETPPSAYCAGLADVATVDSGGGNPFLLRLTEALHHPKSFCKRACAARKWLLNCYLPPRRLSSRRRTPSMPGTPARVRNCSGGASLNMGLELGRDVH